MSSYKYILSFIIVLVAGGCYRTEDMSLRDPGSITLADYFADEKDALQGTFGMYSSLHAQQLWMQLGLIHDNLADDIVNSTGGSGEAAAIDLYTFGTANSNLNAWWQGCYNGISRVNLAIAGIGNMKPGTINEEARANMIAEGKFLRGLYYLYLAANYGGVPLVTAPVNVSDKEQTYPKRATEKEVYEQVFKDLTEARDVLPVSYPPMFMGRATKGAAQAFLGKAYLYYASMQKNHANNAGEAQTYYTKAATELKAVMDRNTYSLDPNFLNNFQETGDNNIESVFEIQFSNVVGRGTWTEGASWSGGQSWTRPMIFGPTWNGWHNSAPNEWGLRQFEANDTIRARGTIWGAPGSMAGDVPYYQKFGLATEALLNPYQHYAHRKYQTVRDVFGDFTGSGINCKLLRYADVLLMYAEAQNEVAGPDINVYNAVNRVRSRAKLDPVAPGKSKAEMFAIIQKERQVEFMGEDIRWYDIKRWKTGKQVFDAVNAFNASDPRGDKRVINFNEAKHYYLPIPQTEMEINPNLMQNNGY